jgi:hypothetical protein
MRALSFLFAALLGIALAIMAPALAGPRPEAPVEPVVAAAVAGPVDSAPTPGEEELSLDAISQALLEAVGADPA